MSKQCLDRIKQNAQEFLREVVIFNETCTHYYTQETKRQSEQYIFLSASAPT